MQETDAELVLYARNANRRIANSEPSRITIIDGDFNDSAKLLEAMEGVAIVYLNDMNSPEATQTIVDAAKKSGVAKIIGATILGIYDEVIGEFGKWNASMVGRTGTNRHKDSAKIIEDSGIDYTLLRLTWLYNQEGNENIWSAKKANLSSVRKCPAKQLLVLSWTSLKIRLSIQTKAWASANPTQIFRNHPFTKNF